MSKSGFSLVELSIVLVILGLLTGGVLTGQSLIRAAELRSVSVQATEIKLAVLAFKQKYFALPGDIGNATAFWDTMSTGTCPNASGTGTETCNGNNDGQIIWDVGVNAEPFLFWQHLSNAGLISGQYNGTWGGAFSADSSMTGKLSSTFWYSHDYSNIAISSVEHFSGNLGNALLLFSTASSGFLTPAEAWKIDKKIDDEKPADGKVRMKESDGIPCHSVAASNSVALTDTATYNLTNDSLSCFEVIFANMW